MWLNITIQMNATAVPSEILLVAPDMLREPKQASALCSQACCKHGIVSRNASLDSAMLSYPFPCFKKKKQNTETRLLAR